MLEADMGVEVSEVPDWSLVGRTLAEALESCEGTSSGVK